MNKYYWHWNGSVYFIKEAEFFEAQGGLTAEWGKAWKPIEADTIEHARTKAELIHLKEIHGL